MDRTAFYVTLRAMDSDFRYSDIRGRSKVDNELAAEIGIPEESLMGGYLDSYLLRRLGTNLGKMHAIGLAHRYLHDGNFTIHGSIVDLDSVHGAPLGLDDAPISADDVFGDVMQVLQQFLERPGMMHSLPTNIAGILLKSYHESYLESYGEHSPVQPLDLLRYMKSSLIAKSSSAMRHMTIDGIERGMDKFMPLHSLDVEQQRRDEIKSVYDLTGLDTDKVKDQFLELMRVDPYMLTDSVMLGLLNDDRQALLKGSNHVNINHEMLFDDYSYAYDEVDPLTRQFVANILEEYDIDTYYELEIAKQFIDSIFAERSEEMASIIKAYVDEINRDQAVLIGDAEIDFMGISDGYIYSSHYDSAEDFLDIINNLDDTITLRKAEFNTVNYATAYTAAPDERLIQAVTFKPVDNDGSSYSAGEDLSESYFVELSDKSVMLFVVEAADGSICYDIAATNPVLLEDDVLHDREAFIEAWNQGDYGLQSMDCRQLRLDGSSESFHEQIDRRTQARKQHNA